LSFDQSFELTIVDTARGSRTRRSGPARRAGWVDARPARAWGPSLFRPGWVRTNPPRSARLGSC